jgi:hypothetical protein
MTRLRKSGSVSSRSSILLTFLFDAIFYLYSNPFKQCLHTIFSCSNLV